MSSRIVLGIETSCDETAAAIVSGGYDVLSSVVASQDDLHAEYRGVVPEIASRAHAERVLPVVEHALADAGLTPCDLSGIAVGNRPGLIGSLLVGVAAAKALAWSLDVRIIGVDHVQAHLHAGSLGKPPASHPALGLVVSGGHTSLYRCESPTSMSRIGATIDDAIGEAFDKVAQILGLGFPGGPAVERLAQSEGASDTAVKFPVSRLDRGSLDFSFSGLKTAVLYAVRGVPGDARLGRSGLPPASCSHADIAASFQRAAVASIVLKVERALEAMPECRALLVGGGVSANTRLRTELAALAARRGVEIRLPPMTFCVDNAAMIAGLGSLLLSERSWQGDSMTLTASPTTVW
jgi:N6-L-threonylcarbamoyladenine synthase